MTLISSISFCNITSDHNSNGHMYACVGDTINYFSTSGGIWSTLWSQDWNIIDSTSTTLKVVWTGCTAPSWVALIYCGTDMDEVYINPTPIPNIFKNSIPINSDTVCHNNTVTYYTDNNQYIVSGSYQWIYNGGTKIDGGNGYDNIVIKWDGNSNGNLSITYQSNVHSGIVTSCQGKTASIPIDIKPLPNSPAILTSNQNPCKNEIITLYTQPSNSPFYNWIIDGVMYLDHSNTINLSWNTYGQKNIQVQYIGQNGCFSDYGSIDINVSPQPASITGCFYPFKNQTETYQTGTGFHYKWIAVNQEDTTTSTTPVLTYTWNHPSSNSFIYVEYYNGQDTTESCKYSTTVPITVWPFNYININDGQSNIHVNYNDLSKFIITQPNIFNTNDSVIWNINGVFQTKNIFDTLTIQWENTNIQYVSGSITTNDCKYYSDTVSINVTPSLCVITPDSIYNQIHINPVTNYSGYYHIYRSDTSSSNLYLGKTLNFVFTDTSSDRRTMSYIYKISTEDTIRLGFYHKTIYLQQNPNSDSTGYNLYWYKYKNESDANYIKNYEIWRSDDGINWGTNPIKTISADISSDLIQMYTDIPTIMGDSVSYYYYIVGLPDSPCQFKSTNSKSSNIQKIYFHKLNSINEKSIESLIIYPNPTSEQINIKLKNNNEKIVNIFDMNGKKVIEYKTNDSLININVQNYPIGLYIVKIIDNNHVYSGKFQKTN
jgi:hypothetical protein